MSTSRRIQKQPAFVLIRRPYSESSLIIEAFSRDYGRVALLAKGARRLKSPYRGLLQSFLPLTIGWSGRRELVTLVRAELSGPAPRLDGRSLMFGWYANELLLKCLQRGDPHENLFDAYARLLAALTEGNEGEWSLRLFEARLLGDVGYGLVLEKEAGGQRTIEPGRRYLYVPERGPVEEGTQVFNALPVRGDTLIALQNGTPPEESICREAGRLTRALLAHLLEGRELRSRGVYRQMYGRRSPRED